MLAPRSAAAATAAAMTQNNLLSKTGKIGTRFARTPKAARLITAVGSPLRLPASDPTLITTAEPMNPSARAAAFWPKLKPSFASRAATRTGTAVPAIPNQAQNCDAGRCRSLDVAKSSSLRPTFGNRAAMADLCATRGRGSGVDAGADSVVGAATGSAFTASTAFALTAGAASSISALTASCSPMASSSSDCSAASLKMAACAGPAGTDLAMMLR